MPDAPPASAGAEDDEFADASGGLPSGWTEVDHGTAQTVDEDEPGLELGQVTHVGNALSGIYKAIPAGDFTYWTKVSLSGLAVTTTLRAGIALWEDATAVGGDVRTLHLITNATQGAVDVTSWTGYTAISATLVTRAISVDTTPTHLYLMVRRATTTYDFSFSTDGIGWQRILTTGALGITPTHIGPSMDNTNSAADANARFAFWRYLASDVGLTPLMAGDRIDITAL